MKKFSKEKLEEIIDSDGNIMGDKDAPTSGGDLETRASRTTDYNANVHGQNYKNDFLGRFGFYFYESEEDASKLKDDIAMLMYDKFRETLEYYHKNPDLLAADYKEHFADGVKKENKVDGTDEKWAEKVMDIFEPHLKKKLDESNVIEDRIVDKSKKKRPMKKKKTDKEILTKDKIEKLSDVLSKLPDDEIDKLINLLEKIRK